MEGSSINGSVQGMYIQIDSNVQSVNDEVNTNITNSQSMPYVPNTTGIRHAVLVVYLAGFFFGAAGNSLVIGIIGYYKNIRIKSVANYYIWNLSLADLLFILTLPFFCYATFTEDWPFGEITCKVSFALRETNRFSSVFLLVALSWDRFVASFYNLSHLRTIKLGSITCVVIWVICATLSVPYWLFAHTEVTRTNQTRCMFHWPKHRQMEYLQLWTYFQLTLGLLFPLLMITLAYILLSIRLKRMLGGGATTSGVKKPSRKMTKTVLVVVITFLVCQTPYYVMEVWALLQQQKGHEHRLRGDRFIPSRLEVESFIYLNAIAQMLVFISSSINPILYGLMNDNYRNLYRVVLCRCRKIPVVSNGNVADGTTAGGATGGGSGSESEGQLAAVASVTYRFQITFHRPCVRNKKQRGRAQSTDQMMLEERSERKPSTPKLENLPPTTKYANHRSLDGRQIGTQAKGSAIHNQELE